MTDLARDKLKDPSLYEPGKSYINGKWVTAKNGKTFDVVGESSVPKMYRSLQSRNGQKARC